MKRKTDRLARKIMHIENMVKGDRGGRMGECKGGFYPA